MQIIDSELVEKASQLPAPALLLLGAVGPLFWVLGWRVHRALYVAAATAIGGIYGLVHGPSFGLHGAIAALLLSLSAGGLALAILRIGVFIVLGATCDLVATRLVAGHLDPQTVAWVRAGAFFTGGLLSFVCYRFLVIALTSFAGAFVLLLGGFAFAAQQQEFNAIAFVEDRSIVVSGAFLFLGSLGASGQYWLERYRARQVKQVSRDPTGDLLRKIVNKKAA